MKSAWSNSVSPLIAGLITAAVFVAGAGAFELGRSGPVSASIPAITELAETPANVEIAISSIPEFPAAVAETDNRPMIVLVIDDAGVDPDLTRRVLELPAALTIAFLPYADATPELAGLAQARGHDIFLHLPMEPFGLEDPGPGALTRHLDPQEMTLRVERAFQQVPGAIGFNNHMGSAFTSDAESLSLAFSGLAGRDLVFLDSLTSGRSRAFRVASELGLTALRRDVFIDHVPGQERAYLDAMAEQARADGHVIAIAHPRPGTLAALSDWMELPQNQDLRFVTIRQFLAARDAMPAALSGETVSLLGGAE